MAAPATASPPAGRARRVNLALLVLVPGALLTGVLAFATGAGAAGAVTMAHAAVGLAVLAPAPWKSAVSRRGLDRRGLRRAAPSLLLATATIVTLAAGIAHGIGVAPPRES